MGKINASDSVTVTEIFSGVKAKMRYFGQHCLDVDGNVMSFNEQMAIVSHYLHNQGFASEKTYKEKALGLMEDIYEIKRGEALNDNGILNEPTFQYSMFRDLFPFLSLQWKILSLHS